LLLFDKVISTLLWVFNYPAFNALKSFAFSRGWFLCQAWPLLNLFLLK
jgi:hypothetical protein